MPKRKVPLTKEDVMELEEFVDNADYAFESKRGQAILMLEDNVDEKIMIKYTGINKQYAYKLRKKYMQQGLAGLRKKKRRSRALLSKKERAEIISTLKEKTPRDFYYNSDFWKTSILGDLIEEKYNVAYKSKTSIQLIFKEAKFTYHKPDKQYKNRDQKVIDAWVVENRPTIENYLHDQNAVVLTEDEMILTTCTTFQKIWLPIGTFPKIDVSNTRKRRGIYGFLNIKTGREHAFKTEYLNAEETVKSLRRLGRFYPNKKIVIIWDNCSWHKCEKIKKFLRTTKYKFHLIQLPPYAPELNPQEHVWKAGRAQVTHNKFIENIDTATDDFIVYLNNTIFNYDFFNMPTF